MIKRLTIIALVTCLCYRLQGQELTELGANYNHDPDLIELDLLERSGVRWVRVTPRFYRYLNGELNPETDEGLQRVIDASNAGYQVIFGWRFDFKQNDENIPVPGSAREREMFDIASRVMARLGTSIDIFTLGNEPNLETLTEDLVFQSSHNGVPLVVFTERLLTEVFERFYNLRPSIKKPEVYAGSFPALFENRWQTNEGVNGLLQFAQQDDRVTGFALHLHISNFNEVDQSFAHARSIIPDKPFIVTEFSLHRLYRNNISEALNVNPAGADFAAKYGHSPGMQLFEWYQYANNNKIQPVELDDLFKTRDWFIPGYLDVYREKFEQNNVVIATYPILQQSAPLVFNTGSPLWFLNPVFMQVTLARDENDQLGANPLCAEDYLAWAAFRRAVTTSIDLGEERLTDSLVFPNPARGKITLRNVEGKYHVTIRDMTGRTVSSASYEGEAVIDISGLAPSTYLLNIQRGKGQENIKFVVER